MTYSCGFSLSRSEMNATSVLSGEIRGAPDFFLPTSVSLFGGCAPAASAIQIELTYSSAAASISLTVYAMVAPSAEHATSATLRKRRRSSGLTAARSLARVTSAVMSGVGGGGAAAGRSPGPAVRAHATSEGPLSVGVPGQPAALLSAHERYGRLPRERVMAPAVRIAREGFEIDWYVSLSFAMYHERLS